MNFQGLNILVIGGTGTIGTALVRRLLNYSPNVIRVYSRDEYKQFEMREELKAYSNIRFLLGDVRDKERLDRAMQDIDIVFNLAALKQVPACEYDPFEAVKVNVIGSQNVIECAIRNRVKKVIYTSSDKAVSPTNIMGATKLLAERMFSSADYAKGGDIPVFASVRFGNVLESRGSVIPLWRKQILQSSYISITEPEMTRFMMSINQAVELILKAYHIAKGGEVFVLKMPVIRLSDLADIVIEMECKKNGKSPDSIKTSKTGLRPGEKMYEELMTEQESACAIEYDDMFAIIPPHRQAVIETYGVRRANIGEYSSEREILSKEVIEELLEGKQAIRTLANYQKNISKRMCTGIIIQARTNSSRLPGKVLKPLPYKSDTTVLQQIIRRVRSAADIDHIIIATTIREDDDKVVEIAKKENVRYYRGSEMDVLDRYYNAALENNLDTIIRITGDCPCIDPEIINQVLFSYKNSDCDYASNTMLRTYPRGMDVEVFSIKALKRAHAQAVEPHEREHVTLFLYQNCDNFKCLNVAAENNENNSEIRITLDTYEDYMLLCSIYDYLQKPDFSLNEILQLFKEKPWLSQINSNVKQKSLC